MLLTAVKRQLSSLQCSFSASIGQRKILKSCIGNESVLKSLSDTRQQRQLKYFLKILGPLECIAKDQSQKGDTRREAHNVANKM